MITILSIAFLVGQCELTLAVNAKTIRQCDHLVVKSVVVNSGDIPIQIQGKQGSAGSPLRIQYQRKVGNRWEYVPMMRDHAGVATFVPTPGPLLDPGAAYAEYETLFLERRYVLRDKAGRVLLNKRGKKQIGHAPGWADFVFDRPGRYELRAVVETSEGLLESKSVMVDVQRRAGHDLERIEQARAKRALSMLGTSWLSSDLPGELTALETVGGNIGQGVKNLLLLDAVFRGEQQLEDDVPAFLAKHMEDIDWEVGLLALGTHFRQKGDWKHLSQVVDALPQLNYVALAWSRELESHRPTEFVPRAKSPD